MFNYKPGPPVQKETSVKMQIGPGLYLLSPFHHLPWLESRQDCVTQRQDGLLLLLL